MFSVIALFALTACSITFTVYSASETAQDYQNNQSDSTAMNAANAESDENRADSYFVRRISLPSNDLIYNQFNQTIYASVPSSAGNIGNSLTQINPRTGAIVTSAYIGSEPNKIAMSADGQTLYTSLNGANAIRRFDVPSQIPGMQFSVGQDSFNGNYLINDFAVAPDNPNVVAVVRYYNGISPSEAAGLLYTSNGRVINPETQSLVGTFQSGGTAMAIDATLHRAFFLNDNVLTAYDTTIFVKIGSATLPLLNGTPLSLVRWGANGLAFRSYNNSSNPVSFIYCKAR